MFDVEAEVFSPIAKALREQFPGIYVTSAEFTGIPKEIPCVGITEVDNFVATELVDSGVERFSDVTYQVTIFTNNVAGKRAKARDILGFVDRMMYDRNFTRESVTPQTAIGNGSIYWMAARYVGRVDENNFYRR